MDEASWKVNSQGRLVCEGKDGGEIIVFESLVRNAGLLITDISTFNRFDVGANTEKLKKRILAVLNRELPNGKPRSRRKKVVA
jgi:hypothetical protein